MRIVAHVGTVVLLDAFCQRYAIRGHNGAALNVGALSNGVVVGGKRLNSRRINNHQEGQVAEKNREEEGKYGNQIGEAFSESNTAQDARFLRLQAKTTADVIAMQNRRGMGATRRNSKSLRIKCLFAWFKLSLTTCTLVTCSEQECNNDKAGKKGTTTLTHEGQSNAGKRHKLSDTRNNKEGLKRQNTGQTCCGKGRSIGLCTSSCCKATYCEQQEQRNNCSSAKKTQLLSNS